MRKLTPGELEPEATRAGMEGLVVRRLVSGATGASAKLVLDYVTLEPQAIHRLHRHPLADQVTFVLDGGEADGCVHLTEAGEIPVTSGDVVHVPAGEWHGLANRGSSAAVILSIWGGIGSLEEAGYEDYPADSAGPR